MIGRQCKRLPCGRVCRILDVRDGRVKVQDIGFWTGWVTLTTFNTKWKVL